MKVFSISDLHLPGQDQKPMDVFGQHWDSHMEKIEVDWLAKVGDDDIVLIPGDISWAMHLKDAVIDINRIAALPGTKVMLKGNHDYWWSSITKIRSMLPDNFKAIQNDSVKIGRLVIAGTRGWKLPNSSQFLPEDQKLYDRELQRLKLSLDDAAKKLEEGDELIIMFHYPPSNDINEWSSMLDMVSEVSPEHVVYGHLHNFFTDTLLEGEIGSTHYHLVSCDYLDFKLKLIFEL